jgi:peptidyl-prolyl cis-trans isomerase A (cyclophilin A)
MNVFRSIAVVLIICLLAGPAANRVAAQAKVSFEEALLRPGSLTEKAPEVYEVKFETTKGDFVVKVTRAWAPNGADRFYNLVKHGYYNGASFFRVIGGFMAQFGINAAPAVNAQWQVAAIKDDPVKKSNTRGFITFAMGGANTRTTQVFINYADNSRLDPMGFAPFGEVRKGMDVVDRLYDGYGDGPPSGRGPRQDLIQSRGSAYLEKEFPKLDSINSATLLLPAPPPPPKKTP